MHTNSNTADAVPIAKKFLKKATFGALVMNIRESDNISQAELARRIGVTRQFLHAIENEKRAGNVDFAIKVAHSLGYPDNVFIEVCLNDLLRRSGVNKIVELKYQKIA